MAGDLSARLPGNYVPVTEVGFGQLKFNRPPIDNGP